MHPKLNLIVDVIVDRTPEELIATVLVALVLALGLAGLFLLFRQKVSDLSTLIICLALGSNLIAMTAAGAFIRYKHTVGRGMGQSLASAGPNGPFSRSFFSHQREHRVTFMASRILRAADADADGLLSADEAATAAAQFVKAVNEGQDVAQTEEGKERGLDEEQLRAAIAERLSFRFSEQSPPEVVGPPRLLDPAPAAVVDDRAGPSGGHRAP